MAPEMFQISIGIEQSLQPAVRALLQQADDLASRLYPGEVRRPVEVASFSEAGTRVLIARVDARVIGLCALIQRENKSVELKRLIVDETSRGKGVGKALLLRAEAEALNLAAQEIRLEVGIRNTDAQKLYRQAGFEPCDAFPPYRTLPISLFMRKLLSRKPSG